MEGEVLGDGPHKFNEGINAFFKNRFQTFRKCMTFGVQGIECCATTVHCCTKLLWFQLQWWTVRGNFLSTTMDGTRSNSWTDSVCCNSFIIHQFVCYNRWDEWVPGYRLVACNEEGLQMQEELAKANT